ncbi:MAG: two component transcriptional regulator, LuxR family [Pedosphaera sp.]|nr:two component transcriptional regulator, LuxR family [Pedosphaera sp.]
MAQPQQRKNRILIVDDHPLFREGLQQMIDRTPDLVVCGEAGDADEALQAIVDLKPDLALVDISLGVGSGIDLVKTIKTKYDDLPVLVISMHDESLYAERALRAGAMGYVMKHERGKKVREAISRVLGGDVYLSERMSISMLSKLTWGKSEKPVSPIEMLSDRELEVFRMLGQGKGARQIAEELKLTIATINTFRGRIKEKLQLKTSTELLLYAIQWFRENGGK